MGPISAAKYRMGLAESRMGPPQCPIKASSKKTESRMGTV